MRDREIKFRAWVEDRDGGYMAIQGEPDIETLYSFIFHYGVDLPERKVILMQYTGLEDKKGKGIFEGDKIMTDKGVIFRVFSSPKTARWAGKTQNIWTTKPYVGKFIYKPLPYLARRGEVVGHIFQNAKFINEL